MNKDEFAEAEDLGRRLVDMLNASHTDYGVQLIALFECVFSIIVSTDCQDCRKAQQELIGIMMKRLPEAMKAPIGPAPGKHVH